MTGDAYEQSARMAAAMGPFPGYRDARCQRRAEAGRERQRRSDARSDRAAPLRRARNSRPARSSAISRKRPRKVWDRAARARPGSTVIATRRSPSSRPTGTIGFLMDCDTTGIEPDIALVKYKLLAGGGMLKIVNQTVSPALRQARLQLRGDRAHHRAHRSIRHDRGRDRRATASTITSAA